MPLTTIVGRLLAMKLKIARQVERASATLGEDRVGYLVEVEYAKAVLATDLSIPIFEFEQHLKDIREGNRKNPEPTPEPVLETTPRKKK